jgi:hypothetical protein
LRALEERVAEVERDKVKTERDKDKAEREFDEAKARLKSLEEANASDSEIARARDDVQAARTVWAAAMETHKAAIEAESRAVESARNPFVGARLVPFSFNPDVRARLERPLSEWQAGETFDVSGIADAVGAEQWHNQLYLRAEGLALLRQWETMRRISQCTARPALASRHCCSWPHCALSPKASQCFCACVTSTS